MFKSNVSVHLGDVWNGFLLFSNLFSSCINWARICNIAFYQNICLTLNEYYNCMSRTRCMLPGTTLNVKQRKPLSYHFE